MKTTRYLCGFLCLATLALGKSKRDNHHWSEPRVIIYEDANFRGGSLVLYPGDQIRDLHRVRFSNGKVINDQISSIRIEGNVAIKLYDHENFHGQMMRTTDDVRNLARRKMPDAAMAWNDRITSLKVMGKRHAKPAHPGRNVDPMLKAAYRDVLGRPADPEGLAYYRSLVIDQGWTDRMVRDHMRRSDEYKNVVVDGMIHRAYHDVLGRAPDPEGLATYRRLVIKHDWSERRLRKELRASPEYRHRRDPKRH